HERGQTICRNGSDVPMRDADEITIEALLDDVIDETIVADAVGEATRLLTVDDSGAAAEAIDTKIAGVEAERDRSVAAIATGGQLPALISALRERETRLTRLTLDRAAATSQRRLRASEAARIGDELLELAAGWRHVLADDPTNARP